MYKIKRFSVNTLSSDIKDALNSIVLPNLPKEYNSLKKFAEGAKKIEKMYYEAEEDWELYTNLLSPEDIAEYYVMFNHAGKDYLDILEFGTQMELVFYYNIKDKSWYYETRRWSRSGLIKTTSFKKPILDLYNEVLDSCKNDKEMIRIGYVRYLEEMIKYVKSSNLK